eukprot:5722401-Pyramimonas_sp.AAC.1
MTLSSTKHTDPPPPAVEWDYEAEAANKRADEAREARGRAATPAMLERAAKFISATPDWCEPRLSGSMLLKVPPLEGAEALVHYCTRLCQ